MKGRKESDGGEGRTRDVETAREIEDAEVWKDGSSLGKKDRCDCFIIGLTSICDDLEDVAAHVDASTEIKTFDGCWKMHQSSDVFVCKDGMHLETTKAVATRDGC